MRDAQFLVQMGAQRNRLRADLYLCGSQCIGGLQPMSALDTLSTTGAVTDLNIEAPHDRLLHDVFLELRLRFVVEGLCPTALRLLRQRNRDLFIHALRNRSAHPFSVIGAALAAWSFPISLLPFASGERSGLTLSGSQCLLKLFAQSRDLRLRLFEL